MALEITPAITYLFNKSLELGRVPKDWLDAHIVPVFKKGDTNTPSNNKFNLLLNLWCGTLLKALLKSSSAIYICFPFDVVFRISSKVKIS
jgi:hypothetical protein